MEKDKDIQILKLRIPKKLYAQVGIMAESYGITKQAVILMILGQHLDVAERTYKELMKSAKEMMKGADKDE